MNYAVEFTGFKNVGSRPTCRFVWWAIVPEVTSQFIPIDNLNVDYSIPLYIPDIKHWKLFPILNILDYPMV